MTGWLDRFDEVERIEVLADPSSAELARLDVLAGDGDSFVSTAARVARDTVARRVRTAEPTAALKSERWSKQGEPAAVPDGSDASLAEGYTAEPAGEGPSRPALDLTGEGRKVRRRPEMLPERSCRAPRIRP